jgi:hypothetical protein
MLWRGQRIACAYSVHNTHTCDAEGARRINVAMNGTAKATTSARALAVTWFARRCFLAEYRSYER